MGFLSKLFTPTPGGPRRGTKSPAPPVVVDQRPWVMVYDAPGDDGWVLHDDERAGDDFAVQVLELARRDDQLVLLAKDYTGVVDETIEDLEARDWSAQYAQVFDVVTIVRVTRTEQTLADRVVPALDVVADGATAAGPQRIRERYAFVRGHQLIITAAGAAAAHERFATDVERWFAGIAFRPSR